jgi:cytochrome c oxidase subunit II
MIASLLAQNSFWLEPPASTSAQNHDLVFYTLLYVMAFFFFLVVTIMLAFVVLYRRRKGQSSDDAPTHNTPLEIFWTIIPLGIVIGFFVVGLWYYVDLEAPPAGADVVDVEASQWQFNFKYPNGAESNELYLLIDRPVVLKLTSKDVTHALYIPAFRVQRNAVPGQATEIWFKPTAIAEADPATGEEGSYHVFCTQYCGNGHAEMNTKAYVLTKEDYDKRLAEAANIFVNKTTKEPLPYVQVGERLFKQFGCAQCHTLNGEKGTGPTWKGLYKRDHQFSKSNEQGYTLLESDGDEKWDDYLVESILHPEAKIVQGFENQMPPQETTFSDPAARSRKLSAIVADIVQGKPTTNKEKKLVAMIEYIKSLGEPKYYKVMPAPPPETGGQTPSAGNPDAAGKLPAEPKPRAELKTQAVRKPESGSKSPAPGRADDRPADLPVDKSLKASPAAKREQGK